MRSIALAGLLLVAACGPDADAPREAQQRKESTRPPMPELEPPVASAEDREASGDAASTLKRYYARIEAGEYDSAWAMRSGEAGDEARRRFADNFRAYQSYHADIGVPSEPVRAGGFSFVEVPVMIRGTFRGGKPFASAGSVTLRRPVSGGEGGWQVYTGEARR